MKTINSKHIGKSLATLALAMFGSSVFAASTWTQNLQADCSLDAHSQSCSGSPAVTLSGWSTGAGTIASPSAGTSFAAATVYNWGSAGLGVVATNEDASATGPHAADNRFGIDAMLVKFTGGPVSLSSLTIGWNGTDNPAGSYTDSDLSVLAWTGGGSGPTMAGSSLATLLSSGWTLVGNYANVGGNAGNSQSISTSTFSSYWLISAYSSAYGTGTGLGEGASDAFKLLSIAGSTGDSKVPEPGSIALLGLGLLGMVALRRHSPKGA